MLQLTPDHNRLAAALVKTTEALREKQAQGGWKPLGNHNYLKQVLQGIGASAAYSTPAPMQTQASPRPMTAMEVGLAELDALIYE